MKLIKTGKSVRLAVPDTLVLSMVIFFLKLYPPNCAYALLENISKQMPIKSLLNLMSSNLYILSNMGMQMTAESLFKKIIA